MNDEIEDVQEVKQTNSQKSIATSNVYSTDFTDSSSDKHNSSGMETYVLEWDSEGSDSPRNKSVSQYRDSHIQPAHVSNSKHELSHMFTKGSSGSSIRSIVAQETYTQTSKTIIELAENEVVMKSVVDCNTLETQTSFLSIRENRTVEYKIEMIGTSIDRRDDDNSYNFNNGNSVINTSFNDTFEDDTSKLSNQTSKPASENDSLSQKISDEALSIENKESIETVMCRDQDGYECMSDFEVLTDNTDIEEDSLAETSKDKFKRVDYRNEGCDTPKSVEQEVDELYSKLYESMEFKCKPHEEEKRHTGYLTPLAEESVPKLDVSVELTSVNLDDSDDKDNILDKSVLFTNNAGIKVKLFPDEHDREHEAFKLPPIQINQSGHVYNNLDFLFAPNPNKGQSNPPPHDKDKQKDDSSVDRWEMDARDLAAGESPLINGGASDYDTRSRCGVQLPPIHLEGHGKGGISKTECNMLDYLAPEASPISINKKIKELKLSHKYRKRSTFNFNIQQVVNTTSKICKDISSRPRTGSTNMVGYSGKAIEAAERGCELLCLEILKKLRSSSWFEVTGALLDIPNVLDKFWGVVPKHRIADLLRLVTSHVESPRTQIARAACKTLCSILKNTNYTNKPDFYAAVAILLMKTGSFSRPVRHAANVALDDIVCTVHLSEIITVLCIYGVTHKSPLVRCASARLLVVCCALGGGGRALLRARPASAATARKHALRSLAQLLDDKSIDTRKYAVRLYSMLRPLTNFEAYYLTDVNVELATTQIKKFDQLLLCGTSETR